MTFIPKDGWTPCQTSTKGRTPSPPTGRKRPHQNLPSMTMEPDKPPKSGQVKTLDGTYLSINTITRTLVFSPFGTNKVS